MTLPELTSTSFHEIGGALAELSELALPGGRAMTLSEEPALDGPALDACAALGLADDTGGRRTWTAAIELNDPWDPVSLSVQAERFHRDAALHAGAALARALEAGPLAGEFACRVICAEAPGSGLPCVLAAFGTSPEAGDVELWAGAPSQAEAAAAILRAAPGARAPAGG